MMPKSTKIFIEGSTFNELKQFLTRSYSTCIVLADENTLQHCYPLILGSLPDNQLISIAPGELKKSLATCQVIWTRLTRVNADRKSLFINLGGGVISDMGGFAASCYKRGIPFINIPTTLLAMIDASVGNKTGIDFMGFKNQIGLFSQPDAIFIYPRFLNTLPKRQLISGFAEVIKHYLIADKEAFIEIAKRLPDIKKLAWPDLIKKNIEIKSGIVEQDPEESGIRKALNFGHTTGHAIESYFLPFEQNCLLHGEAVAAGMITESYLSFKKGFLTPEELAQINKVILNYYKLPVIGTIGYEEILTLIKQDKKNEKDIPQFTLLQGIGSCSINNVVEEELIKESLNYYNSLLK